MFPTGGVREGKSVSKALMKTVVRKDPAMVRTAMLRPRSRSASTIRRMLIPDRIAAGEKGRADTVGTRKRSGTVQSDSRLG